MAYVVVIILDDFRQCPGLMDAWREAGAPGATILASIGLARATELVSEDLPLMPSLRDILSSREKHNRTIFTVVPDEETARRLTKIAEHFVGDFNKPHSGLLFAFPVSWVLGLNKQPGDG